MYVYTYIELGAYYVCHRAVLSVTMSPCMYKTWPDMDT